MRSRFQPSPSDFGNKGQETRLSCAKWLLGYTKFAFIGSIGSPVDAANRRNDDSIEEMGLPQSLQPVDGEVLADTQRPPNAKHVAGIRAPEISLGFSTAASKIADF